MNQVSLSTLASDLKSRVRISDVIATAVRLHSIGSQWQGLCPFHRESTPSFTVSDEKGVYFCHGCGATGDHIDFLRDLHGWSFRQALRHLSNNDLPQLPDRPRLEKSTSATAVAEARLQWNRSIAITGTPAEVYLRRRGIEPPYPNAIRFALVPRKIGAEQSATSKRHPALLAKLTDSQGRMMALGRTFLTRDGRKFETANVRPRIDIGRKRHNLVYLGEPTAHALIAEGLEDGLTLVQRIRLAHLGRPDLPFFRDFDGVVCAALGSRNLTEIDLNPMIERVTFAGDNDAPGRAAVDAGIACLRSRERIDAHTGEILPAPIEADQIYPAAEFNDFNEEWMQTGLGASHKRGTDIR